MHKGVLRRSDPDQGRQLAYGQNVEKIKQAKLEYNIISRRFILFSCSPLPHHINSTDGVVYLPGFCLRATRGEDPMPWWYSVIRGFGSRQSAWINRGLSLNMEDLTKGASSRTDITSSSLRTLRHSLRLSAIGGGFFFSKDRESKVKVEVARVKVTEEAGFTSNECMSGDKAVTLHGNAA